MMQYPYLQYILCYIHVVVIKALARVCACQVMSASESATFFPTRERERKKYRNDIFLVFSIFFSIFFHLLKNFNVRPTLNHCFAININFCFGKFCDFLTLK